MTAFGKTDAACSSCGRRSCEGECFSEDSPQSSYAEFQALCERETRLRAGIEGLVEVEHLKPRNGRNRVAA